MQKCCTIGLGQGMNCNQSRMRLEHLTFVSIRKDIFLASFPIELENNFYDRLNQKQAIWD